MHEVQIFEGGPGLLSFLLGCSPLVGGALQVVFEVHADYAGKDVVHDHHTDVLPSRLDTVEAEKLGQQSARVLIQVLERSAKKVLRQDLILEGTDLRGLIEICLGKVQS